MDFSRVLIGQNRFPRRTALSDDDADDLVSHLRRINLKDCCYVSAEAWNLISGYTWNKLLGCNEECVIQSTDYDDNSLADDKAVEDDENEDVDLSDMSDKPNEKLSH
ncbi:hypothetical protein T4C_12416 [Trichinella pseudospiralis]|uniref:Jerky-like protein-like n=1 Tax=Trichinella pseudospiralis TaxID=6337 RepID=A0A0V0Y8L4_TRIPS|nr:hypothetical protein T4E_1362 [Trichinella pseudospiralis]KRZ43400.1 hypothetical protein T4C_12416 [Trichinella pseudospiralis]